MGMPHDHAATGPWKRRWPNPLLTAVAVCFGLTALVSCGGPVSEGRSEVYPAVEASADEAVRLSVAGVPGGRLASLTLRHTPGGEPVWHTRVVAEDGIVQTFFIDASTGEPRGSTAFPDPAGTATPTPTPSVTDVPPTAVPSPEGTASDHLRALLEEAVLLPADAIEEVTKPHFGKVTALRLVEGPEGRTVWRVMVATVKEYNVHRYDVDAVTGKLLRRSPAPARTD